MSYPTDTKSILVRARAIALLQAIAAGDDFFITPGAIYDNLKNWKEHEAYPAYFIVFGSGGEWKEYQGLQAAETFTLIVHGDFKNCEDAPSDVRKGVRDVRKAFMDDMATGGDGSLASLVDHLTLGELTTDNGEGALVGMGWFNQEFSVTISGLIETL